MKVNTTIMPIKVPDTVYIGIDLEGSDKTVYHELSLDKVDAETLHKLCAEFKKNLFIKAKKSLTEED